MSKRFSTSKNTRNCWKHAYCAGSNFWIARTTKLSGRKHTLHRIQNIFNHGAYRWQLGFAIRTTTLIRNGMTLPFINGATQTIARSIEQRYLSEAAQGFRRWSVGSATDARGSHLYISGPISLINGACTHHANCELHFTKGHDSHAIAKLDLQPRTELTSCYNGSDNEPLTETKRFMVCCNVRCQTLIMKF